MINHEEARKSYGSERARLVYGQRSDGSLVHITEVQRGLACDCICPACRGQLVARTKADHNIPHFAHNGGEACGGGPETVLHLLAKEVFRANPKMVLPKRIALDKHGRVVTKPGAEVETELLEVEYTDPKIVVPDLYIRALGYDLFVEIAVTHFGDEIKIQSLRELRIPAVEVDLSFLPRDTTREDIADAVLRTAPRRWLYHPGIDAANAKDLADQEKWRAAQGKRQAEVKAKHEKQVNDLIQAYQQALSKWGGHAVDVPRYAEIRAAGLAEHVGVEVPGFACFMVPPAVWQAIILAEVFHDRRLGTGAYKAVPIAEHLEKAKLIRPRFMRVNRALAKDAAAIETNFAPPWKSVDAYLKHLAAAEVLVQYGYGKVLAKNIAEPWQARTLAEKKRTAAMHSTVQAVERILGELPDEERQSMTAESWLDSADTVSGLTYRAVLQSDVDASKIAAQINAIVAMLEGHGPLPQTKAGLPIEGAIERHCVRINKQAEERRRKQIEEANLLRQSRRDRLCTDAAAVLIGPDLDAFLNTKRDSLNGMTPLESAEDSEPGLNRAREVLSELLRQRAFEAEAEVLRQTYQKKIAADAECRLGTENGKAFLNGRDDELGRTTPLLFVKNDSTYRKALAKLTEWERQFGCSFR